MPKDNGGIRYGWYGHVGGGYDMIIMVVLIVGDGMMVTVMTTMKK